MNSPTEPPEPPNQGLFAKLKNRKSDQVADRVKEVEGIEPDAIEKRKLATSYGLDWHWKVKVGPWLNWVKFSVIAVSGVLVVSFLSLVIHYLWQIKDDAQTIVNLVRILFELFLVGVAATYFESRRK